MPFQDVFDLGCGEPVGFSLEGCVGGGEYRDGCLVVDFCEKAGGVECVEESASAEELKGLGDGAGEGEYAVGVFVLVTLETVKVPGFQVFRGRRVESGWNKILTRSLGG